MAPNTWTRFQAQFRRAHRGASVVDAARAYKKRRRMRGGAPELIDYDELYGSDADPFEDDEPPEPQARRPKRLAAGPPDVVPRAWVRRRTVAPPAFDDQTVDAEAFGVFDDDAGDPAPPVEIPRTWGSPMPPGFFDAAAADGDTATRLRGLTKNQIKALAPYGGLLGMLSDAQIRELVAEGDRNSIDGRAVLVSRRPRAATYIPPSRRFVVLPGSKKIFL